MSRAFKIGTVESIGPRGSKVIERVAQEGLSPTQRSSCLTSTKKKRGMADGWIEGQKGDICLGVMTIFSGCLTLRGSVYLP
jgi:hypothetical protein